MAGLSDLLESLPDVGGLLQKLDLGSLVGDLTNMVGSLDIGSLLESAKAGGLSDLLGALDPTRFIGKVDLAPIVANIGETTLGLLGGFLGGGGGPPKLKLVS